MDRKPLVLILGGSDSDWLKMMETAEALSEVGIPYEMHLTSAHRTPDRTAEIAGSAREKGFEAIIAEAGMSAQLAGAVAAHTTLPVIGVPLTSRASPLGGMDALLSTAQMPSGVPVGTMAINGTKNAAIFACSILSIKYPDLVARLDSFRKGMAEGVQEKSFKLTGHQ